MTTSLMRDEAEGIDLLYRTEDGIVWMRFDLYAPGEPVSQHTT